MKRLAILLSAVITLCLVSCKQVKYIEVPIAHDVYHNTVEHDTVEREHIKFVYQSGDTIFNNDTIRERVVKIIRDTTNVHDSIDRPVPYPVEVPVEKELSWLQQTLIYAGIASILGFILFLLYIIIIHPRVKAKKLL
jgi:hypothetical protein